MENLSYRLETEVDLELGLDLGLHQLSLHRVLTFKEALPDEVYDLCAYLCSVLIKAEGITRNDSVNRPFQEFLTKAILEQKPYGSLHLLAWLAEQ